MNNIVMSSEDYGACDLINYDRLYHDDKFSLLFYSDQSKIYYNAKMRYVIVVDLQQLQDEICYCSRSSTVTR